MKINKKFIYAGISILLGGMLMRVAWIYINHPAGPYIVITSAVLFLGGVIVFVNTLFNQRHKF